MILSEERTVMNWLKDARTLTVSASVMLFALSGGVTPALAAAEPDDQPVITEAVFFGDSLTDAGTYGFRFTTMPGMTWAQHVAQRLGQSTEPNEHVATYGDVYQGKPGLPGPGGMNYAEGGARANSAYSSVSQSPEGTPISTEVQVDRFLQQHGSFNPNQLVTLYVGTNDVAYNFDSTKDPKLAQSLRDNVTPSEAVMVGERARVQAAAVDEARTASKILANGAQRLLVFKLFDISKDPWFQSDAARQYVGELGDVYNQALLGALPPDPHIQIIDTAAFVDDLLQNAGQYGFTHGANEDACAKPEQDYCNADAMKAPDADRTYVFAAAEHMTTHANELLGDYVLQQIGYKD
jgi:phospholipase/lecithinase/hemolysin